MVKDFCRAIRKSAFDPPRAGADCSRPPVALARAGPRAPVRGTRGPANVSTSMPSAIVKPAWNRLSTGSAISTREGAGEDQPRARDHAAGAPQRRRRPRRASSRPAQLLADPADQEDVVVDAERDEEDEREQRQAGVAVGLAEQVREDAASSRRARSAYESTTVPTRYSGATTARTSAITMQQDDGERERRDQRRVGALRRARVVASPPVSAADQRRAAAGRGAAPRRRAGAARRRPRPPRTGRAASSTSTSEQPLVARVADQRRRARRRRSSSSAGSTAGERSAVATTSWSGAARPGPKPSRMRVQAQDRLGRVAEALGEVERPAPAEVAERADARAPRARRPSPCRARARTSPATRSQTRAARSRPGAVGRPEGARPEHREQRRQQREPGEHHDRDAEREHRAHARASRGSRRATRTSIAATTVAPAATIARRCARSRAIAAARAPSPQLLAVAATRAAGSSRCPRRTSARSGSPWPGRSPGTRPRRDQRVDDAGGDQRTRAPTTTSGTSATTGDR